MSQAIHSSQIFDKGRRFSLNWFATWLNIGRNRPIRFAADHLPMYSRSQQLQCP